MPITPVHAAEIADIMWKTHREKFHRECAIARERGITLLDLIQQRIETRCTQPYADYEVSDD